MEKNRPITEIAQLVKTPCYLLDKGLVRKNCEILAEVKQKTGVQILLALKAFASPCLFELISSYLDGTCVSGFYEAKLGAEEFGKQVHVFSPAYTSDEIEKLIPISDHIIFNSMCQYEKFSAKIFKSKKKIELGLRINPMHSEVKTAIYNPCAAGSRLGIPAGQMPDKLPSGITGLHFHTLCENNANALKRTLDAVEKQFSKYFPSLKWLNFGGGHHITRQDYDIDLLIHLINYFKTKYNLKIFLEPGEAVVLNAGYLIASVLDLIHSELDIAVLDTSASAHMPDVLEMPYRPQVENSDEPGKLANTYRLTGKTCLAGDVIGDYSFAEPLKIGDKLIFHDMAHYTIVKNTTFNGIPLPSILTYDPENDKITVERQFSYDDFKSRIS
ncbi:MAG: carboxynorspermidine decarboxylase [Planctomycetota bacterium]|jgi:carboxynorspermidine decarboxylase